MTTIGETIRRERLRRGLEIEDISRDIKISSRMLEAIEADQLDRLPGGVFTKSFVRQYAHAVGLDGDEIAAELQRSMDMPEIQASGSAVREPVDIPRLPDWTAVGDRFRPANTWWSSFLLVVLMVVICSGIYSLWQRQRHPSAEYAQTAATPKPVERAAAPPPVPKPQPAAKPDTSAPPASTSDASRQAPEAAKQEVQAPQANAERASAERQQESSETAAIPIPAGGPAGGLHIQISAGEDTWVSASSGGKLLFSGVLQTKQTKFLEASGHARLVIGNAGGIDVVINGKSLGRIGPHGQVRIVQVSADSAEIVAKKPAAPAAIPDVL